MEQATLTLRDGSRVRIRRIRRSDGPRLVEGFEHTSAESRYRRFLSPTPSLAPRTVRYLTDVDHHDHEAMAAFDAETCEGIGEARYVRDRDHPDTAEVAVAVVDEWQGRGVGAVLIDAIAARAREEDVRTFTAVMLADNRAMRKLLERLGPVRTIEHAAGTVVVAVPLAARPNA